MELYNIHKIIKHDKLAPGLTMSEIHAKRIYDIIAPSSELVDMETENNRIALVSLPPVLGCCSVCMIVWIYKYRVCR